MEAALREVPVSPSLFLAAELACRNLSISGSDRRRGLPRHISNALASAVFSLLTGRGSRAERLCVTLLMRRTQVSYVLYSYQILRRDPALRFRNLSS